MPQQPFETLVEMHRYEIFAYLWRLIPGDQVEDCLQETFLRAFRAYERTAPDSTYRAWLYKIAANVARTAQSRRQREMARELQNPVAPEQRTLLDSVILSDDLKVVLQAVEALPLQQRAALLKRKYQDVDYKDITVALESSPATARAHVYQALKKLRVRLVGDLERSMEAE